MLEIFEEVPPYVWLQYLGHLCAV